MTLQHVFIITAMALAVGSTHEVRDACAAAESNIYYYSYDAEGRLFWESSPVPALGDYTDEERAAALFREFFEGGHVEFMPDDIKLLSAELFDGHLSINVSGEILRYGGTYYERCLKNQIIRTALEIPGVDAVTLLVENKLQSLPEGSGIFKETAWIDPE